MINALYLLGRYKAGRKDPLLSIWLKTQTIG